MGNTVRLQGYVLLEVLPMGISSEISVSNHEDVYPSLLYAGIINFVLENNKTMNCTWEIYRLIYLGNHLIHIKID